MSYPIGQIGGSGTVQPAADINPPGAASDVTLSATAIVSIQDTINSNHIESASGKNRVAQDTQTVENAW